MADEDMQNKTFEAIELAKATGKIKKGTNEVTKVIENGLAKLVVYAKDVNPPEITMHLQPLCREKNIPIVQVEKKLDLGTVAGIGRPTSSVAIIQEGDARDLIKEIAEKISKNAPENKKET